jgi:transposase
LAVIQGLMTDQEWAIFAPFLTSPSPLGGRPPKDHRKMLDGVFWINRTGAPWRDLPETFGNWNSVHKRSVAGVSPGVWDVLLQALADSGGDADALQMIGSYDGSSASLRCRRRGGRSSRHLAVRAAGSPPRSTSAATPQA